MPKVPQKLSSEQQTKLAEALAAAQALSRPRVWDTDAYNKQLDPMHPRHGLPDPTTGVSCECRGEHRNYKTWLLMTGRGFGKTRAGANWILQKALSKPDIVVAVCAPTFAEVESVCFLGTSGIMSQAQPGEILPGQEGYNKNKMKITLRNGSVIQGFSADRADSARGQNISYCWFDELGMIRYPEFYEEALMPAMRGTENWQILITTTPRTTGLMRDILEDAERDPAHTHLTKATSMENWKDAGVREMIHEMERRFGGNRQLLAQELEGEFLKEISGALFQQEDFDRFRVSPDEVPEFRRVVVGVDPASSANRRSDEHGIVVCAEGMDNHLYTLEDCTVSGTPDTVLNEIVAAYYRHSADLVIVENQVAGDWFKQALYNVDAYIPYRPVHAMHSKQIRAQPLSPLVSRGQVHMVCESSRDFEQLERQLSAMTPYDDRVKAHDDRADAWVWAMVELSRMNAVSYKEIYGFVACKECGKDVNVMIDKQCKNCGAKIVKPAAEKSRESHQARRWSNAYYRTCDQGHEYPMRLKACPECTPDPRSYLSRAGGLSGKNTNWHPYNGVNPVRGRKF